MKNPQKLKSIFDANPKAKKVFISSDGMPFVKENNATNHQHTLNKRSKKDDKLDVYTLAKLEKEIAAEAAEAEKAAKNELQIKEAVEKLAKDNKIDLSSIVGSGTDGSIIIADVQRVVDEKNT